MAKKKGNKKTSPIAEDVQIEEIVDEVVNEVTDAVEEDAVAPEKEEVQTEELPEVADVPENVETEEIAETVETVEKDEVIEDAPSLGAEEESVVPAESEKEEKGHKVFVPKEKPAPVNLGFIPSKGERIVFDTSNPMGGLGYSWNGVEIDF